MTRTIEIDGRPVIDAKKPIKLIITRDDIKKADTKEPSNCAVARACKRELGATEVRVHLARVYLRSNQGNWTRYITPKNMRTEIIAFDRGGAFEAGEYHLSAAHPTAKLGKRRGGSAPPRKTDKKRRAYHVVTNVRTGPA